MTKFSDDASEQAARKQLEQDRPVVEKSRQEFADRSKGKPTPTQEENDLAALGAHILEHDDDGSGPDPFVTRNMEARPGAGGGYETRAVQSASRPAPTPAHTQTPARARSTE